MKIELLKSCTMIFESNKYDFVFQQKTELKDEWAQILIHGKYARKVGVVEAIKSAIVSKAIQSEQIENKAILADSLENKESELGSQPVIRRGRGRFKKKSDE